MDDEFAHTFDSVTWHTESAAEHSAGGLAPLAAEVLFYAAREAMRNAARYGRRPGRSAPLHLKLGLTCAEGGLSVFIEDNGPGLQATAEATADAAATAPCWPCWAARWTWPARRMPSPASPCGCRRRA
jgi:anti-sigma regulatory factor (Ser/Thr protein kinase)